MINFVNGDLVVIKNIREFVDKEGTATVISGLEVGDIIEVKFPTYDDGRVPEGQAWLKLENSVKLSLKYSDGAEATVSHPYWIFHNDDLEIVFTT
jgi:hypothetical protein